MNRNTLFYALSWHSHHGCGDDRHLACCDGRQDARRSHRLEAGLAIGLLLAFATGKIVSSILFDVSSTDPFAFTIAPVVLMTAALLATWVPARRATKTTKISPMAALRTE